MSPEYVYRCRKYAGVTCESKHYKWKPPGEKHYIYDNLVWNNWNSSKPLELIVSDMTAFYSKGIYYELTLYFDTFNREIVGFGLTDRRGDIKPYFEGLEQVISLLKEKEQTNLSTLHTDQGSVYSSEAFNMLLTNNNIIHSMSRAGTPTDNPIDESLNGWIKEELFIDFNLKKCNDVLSLIKKYIYYYNNERPMYCLNYKTPHQYKTDMGYWAFWIVYFSLTSSKAYFLFSIITSDGLLNNTFTLSGIDSVINTFEPIVTLFPTVTSPSMEAPA